MSDPTYGLGDATVEQWKELEAERDRYKAWLDELLAVIHRDGGQYTQLTGYLVSLQEAQYHVREAYRKIAALRARIGQLAR